MRRRFPAIPLSNRPIFILVCAACLILMGQCQANAEAPVEAVTFAMEPGVIYVPLGEAVQQLRWEVQRDETGRSVQVNRVAVPAGSLRYLMDGTELIRTEDLKQAGAGIGIREKDGSMVISRGFHRFTLVVSPKQVEISLARQQLRGWQGSRLVLQSRVSTGRQGRTPAGSFTVGPYRSRMHYSSLYHNAPMPWSVQIHGHVFIHGFASVPDYPASHGCIRLPLDGGNPARFFYEWIDNGSPVRVVRD